MSGLEMKKPVIQNVSNDCLFLLHPDPQKHSVRPEHHFELFFESVRGYAKLKLEGELGRPTVDRLQS